MKWEQFIEAFRDHPVVLSSNLRILGGKDTGLFVQLSRWKKNGRLLALKKGVYLLNPLYRKIPVFEPFLAHLLLAPSYLSLEKALEFHGLIPEGVPVFTSVTSKLPRVFETSIGTFRYSHLHPRLFWGYEDVGKTPQTGFVATPEKALLDFFYLRKMPVNEASLTELRFQNLERLNFKRLQQFTLKFKNPRLLRVMEKVIPFLIHEQSKDKPL